MVLYRVKNIENKLVLWFIQHTSVPDYHRAQRTCNIGENSTMGPTMGHTGAPTIW